MTAGVYQISQGWVFLAASKKGIARVVLPRRTRALALAAAGWQGPMDDSAPLRALADEIAAYYQGTRVAFGQSLDLSDLSRFARRVLRAVRRIPYGQVRTYAQIARQIGQPHAARAVGQALRRNPVPLLVPCHRVIGSNGGLVGFGSGLAEKQRLLRLEGAWPPRGKG